jgi:hypothetical protein
VPTPFAGTFFYVDPVNGNNANPPGNPNQPWKTLTFALCVTGSGKTIRALPGTYSTLNNGEQFPLLVRGQRVESTNLLGAVIQGFGPVQGESFSASVDMRMSTVTSSFRGFRLQDVTGEPGVGIVLRDEGANNGIALLRDLEISNYDIGILLKGVSVDVDVIQSSLLGNMVNFQATEDVTARLSALVMQNGLTGLKVTDTAAVNVRFSSLTANGTQNVEVSSPNVDLGRVGSLGSNSFQNAGGVNVWNRTTGTLTAVGNTLNALRNTNQSNTDEDASGENIANEFFPLGCIKLQAADCP